MDTKVQSVKTIAASTPASVPPPPPSVSREESKIIEPTDSSTNLTKKANFRKYLLKSGFKYAMIRAIVALYEDSQKPDDPLSWIFGFIGQGIPTPQVIESFQEEIKTLRTKIETLQQENSELKAQIEEKENALEDEAFKNEFDWKTFMDSLSADEEEYEESTPPI